MTPCSVVDRYHYYRGAWCFHFRVEHQANLKCYIVFLYREAALNNVCRFGNPWIKKVTLPILWGCQVSYLCLHVGYLAKYQNICLFMHLCYWWLPIALSVNIRNECPANLAVFRFHYMVVCLYNHQSQPSHLHSQTMPPLPPCYPLCKKNIGNLTSMLVCMLDSNHSSEVKIECDSSESKLHMFHSSHNKEVCVYYIMATVYSKNFT